MLWCTNTSPTTKRHTIKNTVWHDAHDHSLTLLRMTDAIEDGSESNPKGIEFVWNRWRCIADRFRNMLRIQQLINYIKLTDCVSFLNTCELHSLHNASLMYHYFVNHIQSHQHFNQNIEQFRLQHCTRKGARHQSAENQPDNWKSSRKSARMSKHSSDTIMHAHMNEYELESDYIIWPLSARGAPVKKPVWLYCNHCKNVIRNHIVMCSSWHTHCITSSQ